MSAKMSHSEYQARCKLKHLRVLEPYAGNKVKILHRCTIDGYEWSTSPVNALRHGCPKCGAVSRWSKRPRATTKPAPKPRVAPNKLTGDDVRERLPSDLQLVSEYKGMLEPVKFRHDCGHTWLATPGNILSGRGCPACKMRLKWSAVVKGYVRGYEPQALAYIAKNKLAKPSEIVWDIKDERMPKITYRLGRTTRTYHPDFFLERSQRIVEVKSIATLGLTKNYFHERPQKLWSTIKAKRKACIDQGYKFTLMLMEQNGNRIKLPTNWHELTRKQLHALTCRSDR